MRTLPVGAEKEMTPLADMGNYRYEGNRGPFYKDEEGIWWELREGVLCEIGDTFAFCCAANCPRVWIAASEACVEEEKFDFEEGDDLDVCLKRYLKNHGATMDKISRITLEQAIIGIDYLKDKGLWESDKSRTE